MYTVRLCVIIAAHLCIVIASFVLFCFYLTYSSIQLFSCKCVFNKLLTFYGPRCTLLYRQQTQFKGV